ncbi:MAG TPA: phosphotransferase family protein, partial [Candidatus Binataceae bacterium]|nr:phosphotransferase family protein [Candidatus Binataceae bacterium]
PLSDFASALSALVRRVVTGATEASGIKPLSGGASQETWSFSATGPNVDRALILRRQSSGTDPAGNVGLEREARLMQAAGAAGVPSPPVLHILDPEDALGLGFLMDHVEGESLGRRIVRHEKFAAIRPKLARQAGQILARIHAIPASALPSLPSTSAARELYDLYASYKADGQPPTAFTHLFRSASIFATVRQVSAGKIFRFHRLFRCDSLPAGTITWG